MKFCKDCKHSFDKGDGYACHHPKNLKVNIEDGGLTRIYNCASTVRMEIFPFDILLNSCGKRGRWFKPKVKIPD